MVAFVQAVAVTEQAGRADADCRERGVDAPDAEQRDAKSQQGLYPVLPQFGHKPIVARLRYAWRCISCRRILMRHHLPLKAIAALAGPLHIKCHCNQDNWLQ